MSRRKQRLAFDQVSEFDRGRIVAYRDCGLSFKEIGSRVGRNQTIVMRICDRWMQEGTTDRRGRSHPPQCPTSREDRQILRMAVTDRSVASIAWSTLDAEPQTSPPPMGGIGYHSHTPLVRIAGTLNSQRYISEVLEPVVLPYLQGLATAIFQQDNARPHVARIVQRFFVNHQIELLLWPARSPNISPIENMWFMVAQRLTQITPPAAPPDQLW
ncbi:transposable element Tcb1 transposase [Trichonephila clavipes]|nr:transposable element Tcb1 transposase [Trichonephila clavipes]